MQIEPKPCPFCGGKAKRYESSFLGHRISCTKCGVKTEYWASKGAATKAWNRRVDDAKTD